MLTRILCLIGKHVPIPLEAGHMYCPYCGKVVKK